jgi:hypothetical protein
MNFGATIIPGGGGTVEHGGTIRNLKIWSVFFDNAKIQAITT